jgi:hypothetical protein
VLPKIGPCDAVDTWGGVYLNEELVSHVADQDVGEEVYLAPIFDTYS